MSFHLVNTSVMSSGNKTLLPWSIVQLSDEAHTIIDFYRLTILPRISLSSTSNLELVAALVGKERGVLDYVDINIPVVAVVRAFGHFLKYLVQTTTAESMETSCTVSDVLAEGDLVLFNLSM